MKSDKIELQIAICDDEPAIADRVRELCCEILQDRYLLRFSQADSPGALPLLPYQIALLDVQLVESSGIDLAREILSRNPGCRIIFISGFLSAVSQVYQVPHFCFILKDQIRDHLPEFLSRAAELSAQEAGQQLSLHCGKQIETVALNRIVSIERNLHQSTVTLSDGTTLVTREKLGDLEQRIHSSCFFRCHASYLINLKYAESIRDHSFLMSVGNPIPISRVNEKQAREAFFQSLSPAL